MIIYPAIDIKDGKCVRLAQGKFDEVTIFSDDPVEMALKWEKKGAKYLHVIDLDGARLGCSQNLSVVSELAFKLGIPCQLGGGIRTIENIEMAISKGVQRVILSTMAVQNSELVKEAINSFHDGVVIGIDARNGRVAINGWAETSDFTAIEFAKKMEDIGVKTIIYTDISRDGMLSGPNLKSLDEMNNELKSVDVIASGGVTTVDDLRKLREVGMAGAIIGRALYTGDIDLEKAQEV